MKRDTLSYRSGCSSTVLGCLIALPGRLGLPYHSDSEANSSTQQTQRQTLMSKQPLAANCLLSTPMPMAAESPDHRAAENCSFMPFIKDLARHQPLTTTHRFLQPGPPGDSILVLSCQTPHIKHAHQTTLGAKYFTQTFFLASLGTLKSVLSTDETRGRIRT